MTVITFLVTEKCKPSEIYRRMSNVYIEVYFSSKLFTNEPLQAWVEKTVFGLETFWLFGKEKVPTQRSVINVMLTVFWTWKDPSY